VAGRRQKGTAGGRVFRVPAVVVTQQIEQNSHAGMCTIRSSVCRTPALLTARPNAAFSRRISALSG